MQLQKHFEEVQWDNINTVDSVEGKWTTFLNIYNEGVEKWVPRKKISTKAKEEWYNKKCEEAKQEEKAWNKWRKNRRRDLWTEYKRKRN